MNAFNPGELLATSPSAYNARVVTNESMIPRALPDVKCYLGWLGVLAGLRINAWGDLVGDLALRGKGRGFSWLLGRLERIALRLHQTALNRTLHEEPSGVLCRTKRDSPFRRRMETDCVDQAAIATDLVRVGSRYLGGRRLVG